MDLPFGGLTVILSGDAYQMQPIGAKSLFCSVVDQRNLMHYKSPEIRPSTVGAELFSRFILFELTEQMRTGDADQISLISKIRDPHLTQPIDDEVVQKMTEKQLTATDIYEDSEWACAPIVVTLNEVRSSLNYDMVVRFAKVRRVPILVWRLPIAGERATNMSIEEIDLLYKQERGLWGIFVAGAPGFLTQNINPTKGLANGTSVTYESISFDEDEDEEEIRIATLQIVTAKPGEVVVLHINPYTINVHVPSANQNTWPDTETLILGRVVLPILMQTGEKQLKVRPCNQHQLTGKVNIRPHAVELAFAITYEKIQGKTMKKIILDLNSAPTRPIHFDAFYTGISRVRRGCDLKIMPIPPGLTLQHLKKLKPDPKLIYWQKGFQEKTGIWSRRTAEQFTLHH